MKNYKILIFLLVIGVFSLLAGCTDGVAITTSWPGFTVDQEHGLVYVSFNAHVYAVNLSNGTEKWRFPNEADNKITFFAEPAVMDDRQLVVGGYNNVLYNINADSGNKIWEFNGSTNRYVGGALVSEDIIIAPSSDNNLYAVTQDGNLRWKATTGHSLWASPVSDGKSVYQPSMDHHLYIFDIETGSTVWKSEDLGGTMIGQPLLTSEGFLYLGTFRNELIAMNASDQTILWRFPTQGWIWSGPYAEDGNLYFGDLEGYVYAVDAKSGNLVWQVQPDVSENRAVFGRPLVIDDTLYFASRAGVLYAVDKTNGNPRWSKTFEAQFFSNLVQSEDIILMSANGSDAILFAMELNGNQRWSFIPAK